MHNQADIWEQLQRCCVLADLRDRELAADALSMCIEVLASSIANDANQFFRDLIKMVQQLIKAHLCKVLEIAVPAHLFKGSIDLIGVGSVVPKVMNSHCWLIDERLQCIVGICGFEQASKQY
jgi:hypothetical protein